MKKKNTKPFDSAAVMRLLKNYEYVMYLDADIIIGNLCKSLKPLIAHMGNAEMVLSERGPMNMQSSLSTIFKTSYPGPRSV